MVKDFKCDLNCPAINDFFIDGICCNNCYRTKKKYLTEKNKHLWTEWDGKTKSQKERADGIYGIRRSFREGFYDPDIGCRLSREDMPYECRVYDCKKDTFYVAELRYTHIKWNGEKWVQVKPIILFIRGVLLKNHLDHVFDRIKRDIKKVFFEG